MQFPLHIPNRKRTIAAMAHIPATAAKGIPVLVLCYGINGNRTENNSMLVNMGNAFDEAGIAFIRFDCCGLGMSQGEFWEVTLESKVDDTLAVMRYISACYHLQPINIFLVGFSDGAKTALKCAAKMDVSGFVFWNPVLYQSSNAHTADAAKEEPLRTLKMLRNPYTNQLTASKYGQFINLKYLREISKDDQYEMKQDTTLFLFSAKDDISAPTRQYVKHLQPGSKIERIESESHVFCEKIAQNELCIKTVQQIKEWMD